MSTIAILTAGGTGTRTHQDLPKQFLTVENKPIIIYTLEAFQQHPSIDEIYVSCLEGWSAVLEAYAKQFNITKLKRIVTGGATGQESIYNGLKAIKEDNTSTKDIVVVVHDGNRPMLPQDVITDNLVKQKRYNLLLRLFRQQRLYLCLRMALSLMSHLIEMSYGEHKHLIRIGLMNYGKFIIKQLWME